MVSKKDQKAKKVMKANGYTKDRKESGKEIGKLIQNNGNIRFMIIELDVLRGSSGSNFKTIVDAKDVQEAIEIFFRRFPGYNNHIIVAPYDKVTEHTAYVKPKVTIRIDKKRPLIIPK